VQVCMTHVKVFLLYVAFVRKLICQCNLLLMHGPSAVAEPLVKINVQSCDCDVTVVCRR